MNTVTDGMKDARKGIKTINSGLTEANQKLAASDMAGGLNDVQRLVAGTNQLLAGGKTLQQGTTQLASGAATLNNGLDKYVVGVGQLYDGTSQLAGNSGKITSGIQTLVSQSQQLPMAVAGLAAYNNGINNGVNQLNQVLKSKSADLNELAAMEGKISSLSEATSEMKAQLNSLSGMSGQLKNMSQLLTLLQQDGPKLQDLLQTASDLAGMKPDLTTVLKSVGDNDNASAQANKQIITDATKIAKDPSSSADAKAAAGDIIEKAKTAIGKAQANGQTLQALPTELSGLKIDSKVLSHMQTLMEAMPSNEEITNIQNMIQRANSLLSQAESLTAQASKLKELSSAMTQLTQALSQLQTASNQAASVATQLNDGVNGQGVNIKNQQTIEATIGQSTMLSQLNQLSSGMRTYIDGVNQVAAGASQLNANSGALKSGAGQLASGMTQLNGQIPTLTSGLTQVRDGQQQMYTTLQSTVQQMSELQSGLGAASDGLTTIGDGVKTANSYLTGLQDSAAGLSFYIPKSEIHGKSFAPAIKNYMSEDKKITKFTIVLDQNPSSTKAMKKVRQLTAQTKNNIKGTPLNDAKVATGGQTSQTADTQELASSDFNRTAIIMVVGIGIALIFVTRSLLQPLFIIGTLLLSYFTSLSLTRWISATFLGHSMLTWNTPFFTFIMIFALGVDYSIFLMMKYRELGEQLASPSSRIIEASGIIGAVVISAAIILSGTFAALMPSGVLTLIQVALGVIIGLVILVVILPIILPAAIHLTYDHQKDTAKH